MKKITDMRINCLDDFAVSMVICVLMSLSSCASDEGNYSYKELNTLSITGVEQSYEIEQFSTLEINLYVDPLSPANKNLFDKFKFKF